MCNFAYDPTDLRYFFFEKTFIKAPIKIPITSPIAIHPRKPMY
ncbi:hypothetical protein AB7315_14895 [Providencia manganoxydans]